MKNKKNLQQFNKAVSDGEEWMTQHGVVSNEGHKQLKAQLLENIPGCKKVDYLIDDEGIRVHVVMYFGTWSLLTSSTKNLVQNVMAVLEECLPDYEVSVEIKRAR